MKIYMFLADGFQETEAIAPLTIIRRTPIELCTVSISDNFLVKSSEGVTVKADCLFSECDFGDADMLVMPGGMPGSSNLRDFKPLQQVVLAHHAKGKPLAAICAAPMVYGNLGLLDGVTATCYPGCDASLGNANVTRNLTEVDGLFITGKGPGAALHFGFAIVEYLLGKAAADEVKAGMMWPW